MPLIQLSYRSARLADTTDDIVTDGIVLPSMRFNREHDITGCLWVGPKLFYQVLEGSAAVVDALYASIARDPRHANVELLSREPVDERQFGRFSMKLVTASEEDQIAELLNEMPPVEPGVTPPLEVTVTPAGRRMVTPWAWQPKIVHEIVSLLKRSPGKIRSS